MTARSDWQIGYAECDITPRPNESYMVGYGKERYCRGTLEPLQAQALAIRDRRGKTALLLAADVIGFDPTTVARLRRQLWLTHRLRPEAVMFCPSHTHWGPAMTFHFSPTVGTLNAWYVNKFEAALLALADQALAGLAAGAIGYTSLQTRIGHCRRTVVAPGKVLWKPDPAGSYDEHTPVLYFTRAQAPRTIVLVGHACHPTSSGDLMQKWSPDYVGELRKVIRRNLGDETRALFVMGCGGDAKTTWLDRATGEWKYCASPARARTAGRRLGTAVMSHLRKSRPAALSGPMRMGIVTGALSMAKPLSRAALEKLAYEGKPSGNNWWARMSLMNPDRRRHLDYHVQVWRFGDQLTLLGLEGEVCSPLGPLARALCATPHAMAVAYVNNACGYIPSRRIVEEGGYEGHGAHRSYFLPAPFTRRVEKEFQKIVRRAVRAV